MIVSSTAKTVWCPICKRDTVPSELIVSGMEIAVRCGECAHVIVVPRALSTGYQIQAVDPERKNVEQ